MSLPPNTPQPYPGDQPPYGQPSYGQAGGGQPPYQEAQFGQPPFGEARYGLPQPGQVPFTPGASLDHSGQPKPSTDQKRRSALIMLIVGATLMILLGPGASAVASILESNQTNELEQLTVDIENTVNLEPNTSYSLFADDEISCSVTAPNYDTDFQVTDEVDSVSVDGHDMFGVLTTGMGGDYDIECTSDYVFSLWISPEVTGSDMTPQLIWRLVGAVLAFAGFVLVIVGVIMTVNSNKRAKAEQAAAAAAMGPVGGYPTAAQPYGGQTYGGQPGPGQQGGFSDVGQQAGFPPAPTNQQFGLQQPGTFMPDDSVPPQPVPPQQMPPSSWPQNSGQPNGGQPTSSDQASSGPPTDFWSQPPDPNGGFPTK